ncbi:cytochrome P450 2J6-like [Lepisosteus oculatus]|uniref:cytochrome P450 2J6-like n=1 Tax=Lepisosteus oculatus TaxID=7918 RepID=UPI0035F51B14
MWPPSLADGFSVHLLDVRSALLFFFAFLIVSDLFKNRKPRNFPPGPWELPVLGNILNFDTKRAHLYITELAERHGNVFSLRIGRRMVVLNELVKEVLVQQGDDISDRPMPPLIEDFFERKGRPFDPMFFINNAVSNFICCLMFGERFEYSDASFQQMLRLLDEVMYLQGSTGTAVVQRIPHADEEDTWAAPEVLFKGECTGWFCEV